MFHFPSDEGVKMTCAQNWLLENYGKNKIFE